MLKVVKVCSYTDLESGVFYVPIRTDLDIFSFEVKAVDNDSLIDQTPSKITLPIKNSSPTISFRYLSNPLIADIPGDTNFTFPTRTFVWDLYDQDGNETITDVFYSLDDTCNSCWNKIPHFLNPYSSSPYHYSIYKNTLQRYHQGLLPTSVFFAYLW
ncbi:hypothetical protein OAC91_02570 [Candidatus Marinimicrobia bacterium]|nr:hypothetical protein [Candidatus Neomarinimicrobiota bacterium]